MLVDDFLTITPKLGFTSNPLSFHEYHQILRDCRHVMHHRYGIMCHVTDISIVRQRRNNYVNVRIKRDYINTIFIWTDSSNSISFCFIASDKLEPVIIIVAINHATGRIMQFPSHLISSLETALNAFCLWSGKLQLDTLQFTYTNAQKRAESKRLHQTCHSSHFHLKLHIDVAFYAKLFPAYQFTSIASDSNLHGFHQIDQIKYVNDISKLKWNDVRLEILKSDGNCTR